ncbi:hypothetical protein M153_135590002, partial [Pseudoloma neurophilia]
DTLNTSCDTLNTKFECLGEKTRDLKKYRQYSEMITFCKKKVLFNTKEFCDTFRNLSKFELLAFLQENTINFKGRLLINNSFYPKRLHTVRNNVINGFDNFDPSKAPRAEYWLWEEMYELGSTISKLKGYDESVQNTSSFQSENFQPEKIHMDFIEMEYSIQKMLSLENLAEKMKLKPENILEYFVNCNFVKLSNGKYTKSETSDPILNQIVTILQIKETVKRKEISFSSEKDFKKIIKDFCNFEKGSWKIKK